MPQTEVYFYCEPDGHVPVRDWLKELSQRDSQAYRKCIAMIQRLEVFGHELRRPTADYLRDGIYELRIRVGRTNYRVLYFFHGRDVVVLAHGLTKERAVPPADIDRAIARKEQFEAYPSAHRFE